MDAATGDFETRSAVDLKKVGVYNYSEHPTTWIWMLSWRSGKSPVQRWHPGDPDPEPLLHHVRQGGRFKAHNANFERRIWNTTIRARYPHWPRLEIEQCDCTMARALAVHLPADLDTLGQVLGLSTKKDREGHALMMKMMRPRKIHSDGSITWWSEPDLIARLGQYCDTDVLAESAADDILPPLSPEERELWELDQRINDRGVAVDLDSIRRIVSVLEVAKERANVQMRRLTDGYVSEVTQATRLVEWLVRRGFPCDSIAKSEHAELIGIAEAFGDDTAKEVIQLRAEAARNSTAKFTRMLETVSPDGRIRGMFNYHRASTGRWGGSGVQPHNLARFEDDVMDYLPAVLDSIQIMMEHCA